MAAESQRVSERRASGGSIHIHIARCLHSTLRFTHRGSICDLRVCVCVCFSAMTSLTAALQGSVLVCFELSSKLLAAHTGPLGAGPLSRWQQPVTAKDTDCLSVTVDRPPPPPHHLVADRPAYTRRSALTALMNGGPDLISARRPAMRQVDAWQAQLNNNWHCAGRRAAGHAQWGRLTADMLCWPPGRIGQVDSG